MENLNIQAIIHYLEKNLQDIQGIYLFGSFASGYANSESDVDIAILCSNKLNLEQIMKTSSDLSSLFNRNIDLIELRYVDTIFQEEIVKTAKRIATFNRMTCELYEDYIFCSAMDFREFRKPHVNEILARGSVYG
jgi:predicted nucleotidyltransferase